LKSIFEKIFKEGTVPNCFKSGIITPVYKKQDKPINNHNSYIRITVSSVIGKLYEKVILHNISQNIDSCHTTSKAFEASM
jgi:hypothetical protein